MTDENGISLTLSDAFLESRVAYSNVSTTLINIKVLFTLPFRRRVSIAVKHAYTCRQSRVFFFFSYIIKANILCVYCSFWQMCYF